MSELLQRAAGVAVSEMDGDLFLVWPDSGEIFHLDAMAAAIWNAFEQPMSVQELQDLFVQAFPESDPDTMRADLNKVLKTLREGGLIVETAPESS